MEKSLIIKIQGIFKANLIVNYLKSHRIMEKEIKLKIKVNLALPN